MTKEVAIKIASIMGLDQEVKAELDKGATPNDALYEWDCPDTVEDAYRCRLSAFLADTSEEKQYKCNITLGKDKAFGVSEIELPVIDRMFQDGEGIIWFHMCGLEDDTYMEFDDMGIGELQDIYNEVVNV